jgi:hypothetical protein
VSPAHALTALLATLVMGLIVCHLSRRRQIPNDAHLRQRRRRLARELTALVVAVAGPFAAGMLLGYVRTDYTLPLLLFVAAGILGAGLVAPGEAETDDD